MRLLHYFRTKWLESLSHFILMIIQLILRIPSSFIPPIITSLFFINALPLWWKLFKSKFWLCWSKFKFRCFFVIKLEVVEDEAFLVSFALAIVTEALGERVVVDFELGDFLVTAMNSVSLKTKVLNCDQGSLRMSLCLTMWKRGWYLCMELRIVRINEKNSINTSDIWSLFGMCV